MFMKKGRYIFLCMPILLISSVLADQPISFFDLVEQNSLFYKKSSDVPFSGQVKGVKNGRLLNGKIDGLWITYLKNGNLSYKANYKNGKRDGLWESYHNNGRLYEEGSYKNGKKNGVWVTYFKNGQLSYKASYKEDKEDGPFDSHSSDDGRLLWKGFYKMEKELDLGSIITKRKDRDKGLL